jgi:hypothetical protein
MPSHYPLPAPGKSFLSNSGLATRRYSDGGASSPAADHLENDIRNNDPAEHLTQFVLAAPQWSDGTQAGEAAGHRH